MIADVLNLSLAAQSRFLPIGQNFVQQMSVLLLLGGRINQTRIRRCILRFKVLDRFKISRIGHDFGKLLQLLELIQLRFLLFRDSSAHFLGSFFLQKRTPRIEDRQSQITPCVSVLPGWP